MSIAEERETRIKFWDAARAQFPGSAEPGTCWVLTEVLGWDWDKISTISVEGFSRDGYRVFQLDGDGKRLPGSEPGKVRTVYRKWTKQEKSQLRDWWWLLGY